MHELLPMFGHTHGSRSAVTCHIKCGDACAHPAPNTSTEPTFAEIASRQLTRRSVLISTGAIAAVAALPTTGLLTPAEAAPKVAGLPFTPIKPVEEHLDAVIVPAGYQWNPIVRWGDPLFDDSRPFNPEDPDAEVAARQFGYNNDYLDILVTDRLGRSALLCCNHEYTNRPIMYPPTADEREVLKCTMAATGFSVVELRRGGKGRPWRYVRGGDKNRRITANTPFALTGPAAGSDLVKTSADPTGRRANGMLGNCSGGATPWGTILAGEENFHNYFLADGATPEQTRYGLTDKAAPSVYGWEAVDPRFDSRNPDYANEPNRFGYIVEIDPNDPTSTPRKHTAMGRLKHEGANIRVDRHGTVVAYMGDDERFDYLYKFVAERKYRPGNSAAARRHNKQILTSGDLYVARFSGTLKPDAYNLGRGVWIPLTLDGKSKVPGMTVAEVCVYTRLAADIVKATPMDRPEDVEPNLKTGKVYIACTNNTDRGKEGKPSPDAPNPRGQTDGKPLNKDGHVIELAEYRNRADATTFTWNIFMLCGDPADPSIKTYFAGWDGPVSPISCPDNVAFDSTADNLWIATDGAPSAINYLDGLFRVPLDGPERGHVEQFLAVPREAETCGPVIHDRDGSVFVAVQHPGEEGTWADQHSFFPDYVPANERPGRGEWRGPRPSVIQVTKKR